MHDQLTPILIGQNRSDQGDVVALWGPGEEIASVWDRPEELFCSLAELCGLSERRAKLRCSSHEMSTFYCNSLGILVRHNMRSMSTSPDKTARLSGSRICEISGVNRQTRDRWVDHGLLRKSDSYDQLDLIEVVVLKLLLSTLRKKEAKLAWMRVRPQLRELMPGPQLTLVWDGQRRAAELALTDDQVVALIRHGRPVQVVDLGTPIEQGREAFRRELEIVAAQAEARREAEIAAGKRRTS